MQDVSLLSAKLYLFLVLNFSVWVCFKCWPFFNISPEFFASLSLQSRGYGVQFNSVYIRALKSSRSLPSFGKRGRTWYTSCLRSCYSDIELFSATFAAIYFLVVWFQKIFIPPPPFTPSTMVLPIRPPQPLAISVPEGSCITPTPQECPIFLFMALICRI